MADSTCDLTEEIIEKYNIGIAPLTIMINGKEYRDKIDIKADEFYAILGNLEEDPTTSMPNPTKYLNIIKEAIEDGCTEILCICMSSGTSGSYQSAEIAKETFFDQNCDSSIKIHIVDSTSMSQGSGWLILKSAILREKGFNFEELIHFNETYKSNVKHFLCVDDLNHLIKSGRLTNVSALIGRILKVKPIMSMRNGKGAIVAKERGLKGVLNHYVKEFNQRNDWEVTDFIIIGYTSERTIADKLMDKIRQETEFKGEIFIMQMGVAVGTHVGLGAVSMFFIEKGHKRDGLLINEMNGITEKKNEFIHKIKNR
ncbi:DegV family protein [Paenibacillus sp. IHBB 10380]|uniref:DegV family protein n=1 Tax=Paenibacillus sp. IHBB 10380 TaxID=1566358 RepID=UPI000ABC1964|nr:DegV family protein [Paenibacillus sp. IHBB 10380]